MCTKWTKNSKIQIHFVNWHLVRFAKENQSLMEITFAPFKNIFLKKNILIWEVIKSQLNVCKTLSYCKLSFEWLPNVKLTPTFAMNGHLPAYIWGWNKTSFWNVISNSPEKSTVSECCSKILVWVCKYYWHQKDFIEFSNLNILRM